MVISYSQNFVFIRIPKVGSTSAETMIRDSGILDPSEDICTPMEGGAGFRQSDGTQRNPWNWALNSTIADKLLDPSSRHLQGTAQYIHIPWYRILDAGLADYSMECISTIRNPVDKFISSVSFHSTFGRTAGVDPSKRSFNVGHSGPTFNINDQAFNLYWDMVNDGERPFREYNDMFMMPQIDYIHKDATVWNLENLFDWVEEFVTIKGGALEYKFHAKKDVHRIRDNDKLLTKDRQLQIIEKYETDYLMWEKAYARFN